MAKKVSVVTCASVLAMSLMVYGYAEITGSGFRNTNCSGVIHINLWVDYDGDGFQGRSEPALSKADIYASMTAFPGKGEDMFSTNMGGQAQIDSLCKGTYTLEIDEATIPDNVKLDGVYEFGALVMDASFDTEISVGLSAGSDSLSPGERHLDIAFGPMIR